MKRRFGKVLKGSSRRGTSFRSLGIEQLEGRRCLAFTHSFTAGQLLFDEETAPGDTNDQLLDVYGDPFSLTVWYATATAGGAPVFRDTTVPIPTALAPISILIMGRKGNDKVDLANGTNANLAGIPANAVTSIRFFGHEDNDEFSPPTAKVVFPTGTPNIQFYGGSGNDTLNGGGDPELFEGDNGLDNATGGGGDDDLNGGAHDDLNLDGGAGDDTINGGPGNDQIWGGDGHDVLSGDAGNDFISGGADDDYIDTGSSGTVASVSPTAGGGPYFEVAEGDDGNDVIDAMSASGSAYLAGGADDDYITGSAFGDTILGDGGDDEIQGWDGGDLIDGGAGNDHTYSNLIGQAPDQPYNGAGANPGWPDMKGSGGADCDQEDGYSECGSGSGPGSGGGSGGGGALMRMSAQAGMSIAGGEPVGDVKSARLLELLASRHVFELAAGGQWRVAKPAAKAMNLTSILTQPVPVYPGPAHLLTLRSDNSDEIESDKPSKLHRVSDEDGFLLRPESTEGLRF